MPLNDIYMLSQIAGVALVVPTLLYLALQVHQNTAQLRATARYQFIEATGLMNTLTASDKATAAVFRRGLDNPDALDSDEQMQFMVFIGQFYTIYSVLFELHEEDLLPPTQWFAIRKDLLTLMASPGGRGIWEKFGRHGLSPKFVTFVEDLANSDEATYDLTTPQVHQ
jgi:hypothetical protein